MPTPTTNANHLALLAIAAGDDQALADILANAQRHETTNA